MQDTRLDIGAVYIPFTGDSMHRCSKNVALEPEVGRYESPIPPEITSAHIDQMTGHAITRVMYDFEGRPWSIEYAEKFLESDIIDQIEVEPYYTVGALANKKNVDRNWKDEVFPEQLSFLRDKFMSRENAARYEDRPMCSSWNLYSLITSHRHGHDLNEKVLNEFGSYEVMVKEMRFHLRVDGDDPFLVAGVGTADSYLRSDEMESFIPHFDGITTWFPETSDWEETMKAVEKDYQECQAFAEDYDMEFIPMAFPGYNELGDTCRESNKRIPRSPDHLRQTLELADTYRTTDMINIATWNDWGEGHTIEPGSYRGNDYGTAYVEIVKEFQQK